MFFITLKDKQSDGSDWTTAAQDTLASYWSAVCTPLSTALIFPQLLRTNSLSGNVFNLEPSKYSMLLTFPHFLLTSRATPGVC
jgi:hypothetical protein